MVRMILKADIRGTEEEAMVDLALGARRSREISNRRALTRDFLAITGLFGTLYAWFILGIALVG